MEKARAALKRQREEIKQRREEIIPKPMEIQEEMDPEEEELRNLPLTDKVQFESIDVQKIQREITPQKKKEPLVITEVEETDNEPMAEDSTPEPETKTILPSSPWTETLLGGSYYLSSKLFWVSLSLVVVVLQSCAQRTLLERVQRTPMEDHTPSNITYATNDAPTSNARSDHGVIDSCFH